MYEGDRALRKQKHKPAPPVSLRPLPPSMLAQCGGWVGGFQFSTPSDASKAHERAAVVLLQFVAVSLPQPFDTKLPFNNANMYTRYYITVQYTLPLGFSASVQHGL